MGRAFPTALCRRLAAKTALAVLLLPAGLCGLAGCHTAPLTVEVRGMSLGIPGEPLFAIVTPSEPGGSFSWKCLTPENSRVLLQDHEWAFFVCDSPAFQPVFEVTFRRRFRKASAYYCPDVIDVRMVGAGSWHPDTPAEKAERARLKKMRDDHVAVMRSPEGIEELRKAIRIYYLGSKETPPPYTMGSTGAGLSLLDVGAPAVPELRRALDQARTPDQRLDILRALEELDRTFALGTLLPEFVRAHDVSNAAALLWTLPGVYPKELSAEAVAGLTCALHSDIPFIRITTCHILGEARAAPLADELRKLSAEDPVPLVRAYAAEAHRAVAAKPTTGSMGQEVRPPAPKWPQIFQPVAYEGLAPADAAKARELYMAAQAAIDASPRPIHVGQ